MEGLQIGSDVHFVKADGEVRAAKVCRVWSLGTGLVNLFVFVDGPNDGFDKAPIWVMNVLYDESGEPNTWHWPPKL